MTVRKWLIGVMVVLGLTVGAPLSYVQWRVHRRTTALTALAEQAVRYNDSAQLSKVTDRLGPVSGYMRNHYVQEHLASGEMGEAFVDKEDVGLVFSSHIVIVMVAKDGKYLRYHVSGMTNAP